MSLKQVFKKISYTLALCILMSSALVNYAYAVNFSTWYANTDMDLGNIVMYQTKGYYSYKNCSNNTATNNRLISEIANSATAWKNGLGISLSSNSSNTSSSNGFVVWCGTRSDLLAEGATISTKQAGFTYIDDKYSYVGSASYKSGSSTITVGVYKFSATVPVYVRTDGYSSGGSTANTIAHEMGHALGWYGHSKSQSLLMYKSSSSKTSPTSSDIAHLKQVYSAYR